jgi:hypothetical protein
MADSTGSDERSLDVPPIGDRRPSQSTPEPTPDANRNQADATDNNNTQRNLTPSQEGGGSYKLTEAQKRVLLSCGFDRQDLDAMRFQTHQEAYDWCGVQMKSPNKRKSPPSSDHMASPGPSQPWNRQRTSPGPSQQRTSPGPSQQRTPPGPSRQIPLTRDQIDTVAQFGHDRTELEKMRFSSVREAFNWVGDCIFGAFGGDCGHYDHYAAQQLENQHYYDDPYEYYYGYDDDFHSYSDDDYHRNQNVPELDEEDIEFLRHGSFSSSFSDEEERPTPTNGTTTRRPDAVVDLTHEGELHGGDPLCGICFEPMGSNTERHMAAGPCGHVYCRQCLERAVRARKKCPTCSRRMYMKSIRNIYLD